jgi:hypothetical protein
MRLGRESFYRPAGRGSGCPDLPPASSRCHFDREGFGGIKAFFERRSQTQSRWGDGAERHARPANRLKGGARALPPKLRSSTNSPRGTLDLSSRQRLFSSRTTSSQASRRGARRTDRHRPVYRGPPGAVSERPRP